MAKKNMFCTGQKVLSKKGKKEFDRIFKHGCEVDYEYPEERLLNASKNKKGSGWVQSEDQENRGSQQEANDAA